MALHGWMSACNACDVAWYSACCAAWCCCGVLLISTWCCVYYMVLRGDGMLGWWMMDVET